jgi:hypothetical protein
MLARICGMLRERRVRAVLLEAPMSPHGLAIVGEGLLARYRDEITTFAAERELPYWDLSPEVGLAEEDFWDAQHIWSTSARQRFTAALALRLAPLLAARGGAQ